MPLKADTEEDGKKHIDKATASFEAVVAAGSYLDAGAAEYTNFLPHTDELQRVYTCLIQAIASRDNTSERCYGLLRQATAALPLQEHITEEETVVVRAIDYAYYLMFRHYETFEKIGIPPEATRETY